MGRGIGLGCEQCDFAATLYERQPFALDATGQPYALAREAAVAPSGYWTDGLCGACRLPVRATLAGAAAALDEAAMTCPRCGAPALTFEQALHELAAASRSRVWLDLRRERAAAGRLEATLNDVDRLRASIITGEMTTPEALDALAAELAAPATGMTAALDGIGALLENALDLDAAARVLHMRLEESQSHAGALELVAEDEAHLPGVPCPQCETGHLIHWPIWE
jgi:hypothetical protein